MKRSPLMTSIYIVLILFLFNIQETQNMLNHLDVPPVAKQPVLLRLRNRPCVPVGYALQTCGLGRRNLPDAIAVRDIDRVREMSTPYIWGFPLIGINPVGL